MNAVPTLPIKPDMPASAAPSAFNRDQSQPSSSFRATLHKVKADKPSAPSDQDPHDAPPAFSGEDQNASVITGEEPHATDPAEPQAVGLIEDPAELFSGAGLLEEVKPAIDGGGSTGDEKSPLGVAAVMPQDKQAADGPPDLKTVAAPIRPRASGQPPARAQSHLPNTAPVVLTTPGSENANPDSGLRTAQSLSPGIFARTAEPNAPGVEGTMGDSGPRLLETGEKGTPVKTEPLVNADKRIPAQAGPGQQGPLVEGAEAAQSQSATVAKITMASAIRRSPAPDRQAGPGKTPAALNLIATLGRESGHTSSETPESTPSARLVGENAGPHDGPGLSADGERAEDHPRRWLGADQGLETARSLRTARLDADARADWIATVDRQGMSPVNKPSSTIFVEKDPTLTADSFRSQNLDPIVERIAVSVRGNQSEARIALKPDHLGSIRLQIATDNGIVNIKIMTEFPMARDLLESHLPQLKTELQQQGLDLDEFTVTLDKEAQDFRREDRRQQGTFRPPSDPGRRDAHADRPGHDRPENPPTAKRSTATGVDFFA